MKCEICGSENIVYKNIITGILKICLECGFEKLYLNIQ